jgi:hypothetical protein
MFHKLPFDMKKRLDIGLMVRVIFICFVLRFDINAALFKGRHEALHDRPRHVDLVATAGQLRNFGDNKKMYYCMLRAAERAQNSVARKNCDAELYELSLEIQVILLPNLRSTAVDGNNLGFARFLLWCGMYAH